MANTSSYVIVTDNEADVATDNTTYVFNPTATLKTFTLGGASDGDTIAIDAASTDFRVRFFKNEMTLYGLKNTPSAGVIVKIQMDPTGGTDHLTFLDGTVDVDFAPGTGSRGHWTFGDHAVGRNKIVLSRFEFDKNPTYTYADAAMAADGALNSETYILTKDIDDVEITSPNTYDIVKGVLDYDGSDDCSTWTLADEIHGNGKTHLQIAVADIYGEDYEAPFSCVDGVERLSLINGDTGVSPNLTIDGHFLGSDLNVIDLSGKDGLSVEVEDLEATGDFYVSIDGQTTGTVEVAGTDSATFDTLDSADGFFKLGDLNAAVYLKNTQAGAVDAYVKMGTGGIDVVLGEKAYAEVGLTKYECSTVDDVSLGDIQVASINLEIGKSACAYSVLLDNSACASGHNAEVGNIAVGDVTIDVKESGCGYLSIENEAYVFGGAVGNATAGNVTVGNIAVTLTNEANGAGTDHLDVYAQYITICNSADMSADKGNATVGNITLGSLDVEGNGCFYMEVVNSATNNGEGNATAGNVTIGDIHFANGTDDYFYLYVCNCATADTGNATVGDINVGNISLTASYENCVCIDACAEVDHTGNATIGNLHVGNINMKATGTGTNQLYFCLAASQTGTTDAGGETTIGNVTIGNINMMVASSTNCIVVCEYAYGDSTKVHDVTIGNLSIGNVTMGQLPGDSNDAENCICIERCAYNSGSGDAVVGNVVVGNISINQDIALTQTDATNQFSICNYAYARSGNATAGAITIGNINARTADDGYACVCVINCADGESGADEAGLITVGNVNMEAIGDGEMALCVCNYADEGLAAGIKVGNVSMKADDETTGSACLYLYESGDAVGNISVGNVTLQAEDVYLCLYNCAEYDDAGTITMGDVTIIGENADSNYITNYANDGSTGAIAVGNVSLTAGIGDCIWMGVCNYADDAVGNITIKDVVLNVTADSDSADTVYACLYVCANGGNANGGNVTVGNITINAKGNVATKNAVSSDNAYGCVTLESTDGTVTVGNITVTGGVVSDDDKVDGFDDLGTWLSLTAKNDAITIGNVDYSGYAGKGYSTTLIDVSGYAGAAVIKGATGGSTITDNDGTNAITLSNTAKDDLVVLQDDQSWITNSTTTGGAGEGDLVVSQAAVDTITGFAVGDMLTTSSGISGHADNDVIQAGSTVSWTQFLTNAEHQIDNLGHAAYSAYIGGNTYVALAGDDDVVQSIVKIVGKVTFTFDSGNLDFQSAV